MWNNESEEKLIQLVSERQEIWDKTHSQHTNSYWLSKKWDEVSQALNISKEKTKNKYKALTATYRKEKEKINKLRSGAGADEVYKSSWPHFNSMEFLNDKISNTSSGNIDVIRRKSNSLQTKDSFFVDMKDVQAAAGQASSKIANEAVCSDQNTFQLTSGNALEQANWHYFLSLIPYLKKVQDQRNKLKFRMEMTYLLFNFLTDQEKACKLEKKKEQQHVQISDDDDCKVVDFRINKKNNLEGRHSKYEIKKEIISEIQSSPEFHEFVKNHFH